MEMVVIGLLPYLLFTLIPKIVPPREKSTWILELQILSLGVRSSSCLLFFDFWCFVSKCVVVHILHSHLLFFSVHLERY